MAKPHAGSRKRVEKAEKEPATGKSTAISPRACTVQYSITPIRMKAMRSDAGPPPCRAFPEPTNKPVPAFSISQCVLGHAGPTDLCRHVGGRTDGSTNCNHL